MHDNEPENNPQQVFVKEPGNDSVTKRWLNRVWEGTNTTLLQSTPGICIVVIIFEESQISVGFKIYFIR